MTTHPTVYAEAAVYAGFVIWAIGIMLGSLFIGIIGILVAHLASEHRP